MQPPRDAVFAGALTDLAAHDEHLVDGGRRALGVEASLGEEVLVVPEHGDADIPRDGVVAALEVADAAPEVFEPFGLFGWCDRLVHVDEDVVLQEAGQIVDVGQVWGCVADQGGEELFGHFAAADIDPLDLHAGMRLLVLVDHAQDVVGECVAEGNGPELEGDGGVLAWLRATGRKDEEERKD